MVNHQRSWQKKWFLVGVFSLILWGVILLLPETFLRPVHFAVNLMVQPVERIFSFFGFKIHSTFSVFGSIGTLHEENARLLNENIRLQSEVTKLHTEEQENALLREQLGVPQKKSFETISAEVIGQTYTDSGRWIALDRGTSDGIQPQMPVIIGDGVLIGRIDEVSLTSSRVMLLTHPDSVLNAQDEDTHTQGVIRGAYGLGLVFDRVPQTDSLSVGDRISTSGLGGGVPSALLIGTVEEVRTTPDHLFQQGTLKPIFPFENIRFVRIIRSS
jgi:rod shape-determining protein MreC